MSEDDVAARLAAFVLLLLVGEGSVAAVLRRLIGG